jgi:hypothetical protein
MQLRRTVSVALIACAAVLIGRVGADGTEGKPTRLDEVVTELTQCTIPCDYGDSLARVTLWENTIRWNNAALWNMTARKNAETARAKSLVAVTRGSTGASTPLSKGARAVSAASGRCGGSLPPCWIMMRESGGNIRAMNPSGAAGKWQIMPGTWNGYGGYASAAEAPEAVQDAKARTMAPCNWVPPNYCAR